jgi:hypothetical protein
MKVRRESVSNFTYLEGKKFKISEVVSGKYQFHHQQAIKEINIENRL